MRKITSIPEGGCDINDRHKYVVVDSPDHGPLSEGVTREWVIVYCLTGKPWKTESVIRHADTKEVAFQVFTQDRPDTQVKSLKYLGIWF